MSAPRSAGCNCDPEMVFELADRALGPGREREVRRHLDVCPGCRELYEREVRLNDCLGSLEFHEANARSVRESVAMALPTRPVKARLLWALLAVGLLGMALFALGLQGANPAAFVMDAVETFQGASMILNDVLGTTLTTAGSVILIALAVGAVLDLLLAAVLFAVVRRRTREV